ncbi:MAG: tyrosine-type recombinase/integrase [Sphingobium sp.]
MDRHKKERLRFRRKGFAPYYFKAQFGTEEFREEYRLCLDGLGKVEPGKARTIQGTIAALVAAYVSVPSRLGPTDQTRRKIRNILDKFREKYGTGYVRDVTFDHIDQIIAERLERKMVGKRMEGGPEAAKKLRKELVRLFDFAIKLDMIATNPVRQSERVKVKAGTFHTWTEGEIDLFRAKHPIGSKARLAMELMLWTGQRRADAYRMSMADIKDGTITVTQSKTGKTLRIPIAPQLLEAIVAMPPQPADGPLLLTEYGKPFTSAGFGNWFRDQCDDAGLPQCSAHGLRKANMRRMANLGMGNQSMKSVSGHSRDDEVALYTRAADQEGLATRAISLLAEWEMSRKDG